MNNSVTAILCRLRDFKRFPTPKKDKKTSTSSAKNSHHHHETTKSPRGNPADESFAWCPAQDFFKKRPAKDNYDDESIEIEDDGNCCYSFIVPIYGDAADGEGFTQLVKSLTNQLEEHIKQASRLVNEENGEGMNGITGIVEETLRVAIGRTQLLLGKRMKQFKDHLNQHLNPDPNQKLTKFEDLLGLWSLIDTQLEDIRQCFANVENYRLANWKAPAADEDGKECENGK